MTNTESREARKARAQKWIDAFKEKAEREKVHRRYTREEFNTILIFLRPIAETKYIFSKNAPVLVVEGQLRFRCCDSCSRWFAGPKKRWCGGCKNHLYCSKECQVTAWPRHRRDCKLHWRDLRGQPSGLSNPQGTKMFFRPCGYCGRKTQGTPHCSICDRCRNSCHFCDNQVRDSPEVD